MITEPKIIGSHAFFFRDGAAYTSPTSGTAGRESKPDGSDPAWVDLGIIDEFTPEKTSDEKEIYKPQLGAKVLYDVLENKHDLKLTMKLMELGPFALELMYGTEALTSSSTQFNPLEGRTVKGWLQIRQYDHDDAALVTLDVYCRLKAASAPTLGDDPFSMDVEGRVLFSTLNTGSIDQ